MNAPAASDPLKCPVCAARFRGGAICPRCGTDLGFLMRIAGRAWKMRQEARQALRNGDLLSGLRLHALAQQLQKTAF